MHRARDHPSIIVRIVPFAVSWCIRHKRTELPLRNAARGVSVELLGARMEKRSIWRRLVKIESGASIPQALLDNFIDKWEVWVAAIVSGGGMTYLATITAWLNTWGPIAWAAAFWSGVFLFLAMRWIWVVTRFRKAIIDYTVTKTAASGVKTLEPTHQNERIELWCFYHPFFKPTENIRFENCDLVGPTNFAMERCQFLRSAFIECEIVIVRPDRPVMSAARFKSCILLNCRIYRVTLLMNKLDYDALPPEMRSAIPVISDGRISDV